MRNWLLPESIDDVLPDEAARLEALRRTLLDHFAAHRLPPRAATADRASRIAADRQRTRPRPADVQGRRPAVGPARRRARRHHAAGRTHRRAPAERSGCNAPLLCGQRAARRHGDARRDARSRPGRRRALRRRGDRRRSRSHRAARIVAVRGRTHAGCTSTSATSASIARWRAAPASPATATKPSSSTRCERRTSRPCAR